ncbi:MAG: hypothetical protein AB7R40_24225 [Nitrospiraceae bacterium]
MSLSQFVKDHALLSLGLSALGGVLATGVIVVLYFYYMGSWAIPDLKAGQQQLASALREYRKDAREALDIHVAEERAARDKTDVSMRAIQSTMIAVMQKLEQRPLKPSEINHLLSSVRDVSVASAKVVAYPTIASGSTVPTIAAGVKVWSGVAEPGLLRPLIYPAQSSGTVGFLARGILASNGAWEATDNGLTLKYDGGIAKMSAKEGVTSETLKNVAETLNIMSRAVSQAAEQDAKVRDIKKQSR